MKGVVESVSRSSSGKSWRVKVSGKEYGASLDSKLDQHVGKFIDFDWDDGKFGPWIKSWGSVIETPAESAARILGAPMPAPKANGDRFYMPFVSNVVAHAIAAGQITTPQQISPWAKAAHDAAVALDML